MMIVFERWRIALLSRYFNLRKFNIDFFIVIKAVIIRVSFHIIGINNFAIWAYNKSAHFFNICKTVTISVCFSNKGLRTYFIAALIYFSSGFSRVYLAACQLCITYQCSCIKITNTEKVNRYLVINCKLKKSTVNWYTAVSNKNNFRVIPHSLIIEYNCCQTNSITSISSSAVINRIPFQRTFDTRKIGVHSTSILVGQKAHNIWIRHWVYNITNYKFISICVINIIYIWTFWY